MRSTGTGPALRWAAGVGPILGVGVGSPAGRNGGADGTAVGLALCASPLTRALPAPGSWQPPAMWSLRSSSTGSVPQDACKFVSGTFKIDFVSVKRIFFLV